jgi:hypothetical protein
MPTGLATLDQRLTAPTLLGEVTLQLVDVATGEVVHEQVERNILTNFGMGDLLDVSTSVVANGNPRVFISERRNGKNPSFSQNNSGFGSLQAHEVATLTPSTFANGVTKTLSTPYLAEFRGQFNPGTSNRTIWAVGVCSSADSASAVIPRTLVSLASPCTQAGTSPGPGQILFLTYRIQVLAPAQDPLLLPVAPAADRYVMEKLTGNFTADGAYSVLNLGSFSNIGHVWNAVAPRATALFFGASDFTLSRNSSFESPPSTNGWARYIAKTPTVTPSVRYGQRRYTVSYANSEAVGCIFGSFVLGTNTQLNIPTTSHHQTVGLFCSPAVRPTWQPVQNIFGHSASGTEPFQQVTQLATGTGVLNATGINWTDPSWPEYYRVEVTTSGGVGASRYAFARRVTSGFTQNSTGTNSSWTTGPMTAQILFALTLLSSVQQAKGQNATLTGSSHYQRVHPSTNDELFYNVERFDATSIFSWDATGTTLFKLKEEKTVTWDASSVPALPVTAVRQVCADGNGNLWVACANTGLWKINVAGNTVTNYTTFNSLSTTNAYAVGAGLGGRVFALLNGGLVSTTNQGTTWINETFSFTGISDSNWDKVYWLMVQRTSPTFRLAIGRSTDGGTSIGQVVWWSTAAGPGIAGPTFTATNFGTQPNVFRNTRCWRVADSGDVWVVAMLNGKRYLSFGSASLGATLGSASPTNLAHDFLYDYYGTPYQGFHDTVSSETNSTAIYDPDAIAQGKLGLWSLVFGKSPACVVNLGGGMTLSHAPTAITALCLWSPAANWSTNLGGINPRVNLNQKDTCFEEFVWDHYRWDGSTWVKGYHAPALDTAGASGGPFNGARHRFDVENHAFTGRSCIVLPTAALTTHFTNKLTFAAVIAPLAPQSGQGTQAGTGAAQQLFSWVNLAANTRLQVYLNNGSNAVTIKANGVVTAFGTSPTYGGTHNVVVVIDGTGPNTTAAVYVNGAQLGTTQTIISGSTPAFNASNAELVIGGNRVNVADGAGFTKATEFYRGTMLNVLLDSAAWTSAEVAAHQAAPLTYTTPTTRVRYQLNDSLAGLETKATHGAFETLLNGVDVKFTNGAGPQHFVTGESYTFGVCHGILKDNATSFTHSSVGYLYPVVHNFADTDLATIPATTTSVTERLVLRGYNETYFSYYTYATPGYVPTQGTSVNCYSSFQSTTGDFTLTAPITNGTIPSDTAAVTFDLGANDTIGTFPGNTGKWTLRLKGDGNIDIIFNGSVVLANATTWTVGDTVTITRTAGVFTFFKNSTLLYTTSGGQNSTARVWFTTKRSSMGSYQLDAAPITLTYDRDANIVGIGNPVTLTGKYDPSFHNFDGSQANYFTVNIAGYSVPAAVTIATITATVEALLVTPPAANGVIIVPDAGYMLFNSADAGKAVTVNCTMIKRIT